MNRPYEQKDSNELINKKIELSNYLTSKLKLDDILEMYTLLEIEKELILREVQNEN